MDGTGAWHLSELRHSVWGEKGSHVITSVAVKGYPVIDGVLSVNNVSFGRFTSDHGCDYGMFAVGNNPLSPDAVHPMQMTGTSKFNVHLDSLAFFYEPNPDWIVQEVCGACYGQIKRDYQDNMTVLNNWRS